MTIAEARNWIEQLPWRAVRQIPYAPDGTQDPSGKPPDPHEYVIGSWREVDQDTFDRFIELIRSDGYRAAYTPPYRPEQVQTNDYLQIDGWIYWFIAPEMLNRERAEERKHVPVGETPG